MHRIYRYIFTIVLVISSLVHGQQIIVAGNNSVPTLDKAYIKSLYLGFKTSLPGGGEAKIYMIKDDRLKELFITKVLGLSVQKYKSHWLSKALAGEGVPPPEITANEMKEKLASEKGSIGFIEFSGNETSFKVLFKIE